MLSLKSLAAGLSVPQLIGWGTLYYSFAVFLAPVERELGLSRFESSAAFSLALLFEGVAAPWVGRWIDGGHGRAVMTFGSLLAAAGLALFGQAHGREAYYLAWTLIGASMAMVLYGPCFSIVLRQFPARAHRGITAITLVGGLASTVFLPLTAGLVEILGRRGAALGLAGLHLVVCLPVHAGILGGLVRNQGAVPVPAAPAGRVVRRPQAYALVGVFLVSMTAVTAALPVHLVSLLGELSLPAAWVWIVPAGLGAMQVVGRAGLMAAGSRWDPGWTDRWAPAALPLGLGLLLLAVAVPTWAPAALVLFVPILGIGNGVLTIVKGTAVSRYVQTEQASSLNGNLGLPLALARAASPLVVGWTWSPESGYLVGFGVLWGLSVVGLLAWGRLRALTAIAEYRRFPSE